MPCFSVLFLMWLTQPGGWPITPPGHFAIDLQVQGTKTTRTAHAETRKLGVKAAARPILEAKVGESLTVHWRLRRTDRTNPANDLLVHFVVVREA
jgi:hypothetical protein